MPPSEKITRAYNRKRLERLQDLTQQLTKAIRDTTREQLLNEIDELIETLLDAMEPKMNGKQILEVSKILGISPSDLAKAIYKIREERPRATEQTLSRLQFLQQCRSSRQAEQAAREKRIGKLRTKIDDVCQSINEIDTSIRILRDTLGSSV